MVTAPNPAHLERDLLGRLISQFEDAPPISAAPIASADPSLLSSAWQKAIRRSDVEVAQRSVASLHQANPAYVWRRMRGIALEEVSVADLELVGQVLAIAGKQATRQKIGDLALAIHLTTRLALADKCRTACDLLMWFGAPSEDGRVVPPSVPASTPVPLQEALQRASAWLTITARSGHVAGRWVQLVAGDVKRRDELLEQSGYPPLVQFIVRRGSSTDALNSLLVPVYQLGLHRADRLRMLDRLPESSQRLGGLPSYAYCLFSGPGRTALRRLLTGELGRYCRQVDISDPLRSVGHAVFQLEGGYCRDVLQVAHAPMIRHRYEQATLLRYGTPLRLQTELRHRVRAAMPELFEYRRQVYQARKTSDGHVEEPRPRYGFLHEAIDVGQACSDPHTGMSDPCLGRALRVIRHRHVEHWDTS